MINGLGTNLVATPALHKAGVGSGPLQLFPIKVNEDYRQEWNIHCSDFLLLTKDGEPLRNTLYRVGGLGKPNLQKDNYFLLLKHVEAFYEDKILKWSGSTDPKHLESQWCIIDKYGNEKVTFSAFKHPYLVKDSCIYSLEQKYYNIETGEFYCYASTSMESSEHLFLENRFDDDKSRRGVMQINKKDGSWKLFS